MVLIAVVVLGGEMYEYAFVLDSGKVDDINGILNDTSCVIPLLLLLGLCYYINQCSVLANLSE